MSVICLNVANTQSHLNRKDKLSTRRFQKQQSDNSEALISERGKVKIVG